MPPEPVSSSISYRPAITSPPTSTEECPFGLRATRETLCSRPLPRSPLSSDAEVGRCGRSRHHDENRETRRAEGMAAHACPARPGGRDSAHRVGLRLGDLDDPPVPGRRLGSCRRRLGALLAPPPSPKPRLGRRGVARLVAGSGGTARPIPPKPLGQRGRSPDGSAVLGV